MTSNRPLDDFNQMIARQRKVYCRMCGKYDFVFVEGGYKQKRIEIFSKSPEFCSKKCKSEFYASNLRSIGNAYAPTGTAAEIQKSTDTA